MTCVEQDKRIDHETCRTCHDGYYLDRTSCSPYGCDVAHGMGTNGCRDCVAQNLRTDERCCSECYDAYCLVDDFCVPSYEMSHEVPSFSVAPSETFEFEIQFSPCAFWSDVVLELCTQIENGTDSLTNETIHSTVCETIHDTASQISSFSDSALNEHQNESDSVIEWTSLSVRNVSRLSYGTIGNMDKGIFYNTATRLVVEIAYNYEVPIWGSGHYTLHAYSDSFPSDHAWSHLTLIELLPTPQQAKSAADDGFFSMGNIDAMSITIGAVAGIAFLGAAVKVYNTIRTPSTKPDDVSTLTQNSLSTVKTNTRRPSHALNLDFSGDDGVGDFSGDGLGGDMDTAGL